MMTIAFENLLKEHFSFLQKQAVILTKNSFDADDLFQDTMEKIVKNADKFILNSNFKAWITTIMRNAYINQLRKNKRLQNLSADSDREVLSSPKPTVDNEGESNLEMAYLYELLNEIEEEYRLPLLMHYEGFKYEEIAEQLNISLGTIKSRIHMARKKLHGLVLEKN